MTGQSVSHYTLLEKVGEGGMGIVYKARDMKLDRLVALKFLPPLLAHNPKDKARFLQEAKAASAIDHPGVCSVHEIDETRDGRAFIAMSFCEGISLNARIQQAPLLLKEALDISMCVAEGLQAAHEKGIVHRDIKSSNILVPNEGPISSGRVKIIDFGLAENYRQTSMAKTGYTGGTVLYMSPEQARGETVDQRTDVWSLGVVLYEMLTGKLPFWSECQEAIIYLILNEDPPPVTSLRRDIPPEVERVVTTCLEKEPARRYQNMDELLRDLRQENGGRDRSNERVAEANILLSL